MDARHYDVLIVGAGLSGVAGAYYLQDRCPQKSFAILEARDAVGGTWDLFQYPGIRSDSDMHTLGFSFFPWKDPQAIADGPSILSYIQETVAEYNLDDKIHFGTRVVSASWSSDQSLWTVQALDGSGESVTYTCWFLWACTGYYSYESGHAPAFAGADRFEGEIVHPQHWPADLDYTGQRIVVIGSGATAVTLVPELAKKAAHVTMLQRSPTYVMSIPRIDGVAEALKTVFGLRVGSSLTRWKNILRIMFFYQLSRRFPEFVRKVLIGDVRKKLGPEFDVETHFTPDYDPWDQRVCFVPDDDLFDTLNRGEASVVTDHIEAFTENGIALESGQHIDADLIVTATGLKIEVLGGAVFEVDGERIEPGEKMMYKGTMMSDVPNSAISLGYTNASWTLKCELVAAYICRLISHMDAHGKTQAWPRHPSGVETAPLVDFNSGYVLRALDTLPAQGSRAPWRLYQNYFLDRVTLHRRAVDDGVLDFR